MSEEFVELDTSGLSDGEKLVYLISAVHYLLNKRPKSNPQWTLEECDAECAFTSTPVPKAYLKEISADDGNRYLVHPGIFRMMQDNNVDVFPMDWLSTDWSDPDYSQYLEIPPRRRGRKPGSGAPKKEPHVPIDMTNWGRDDVANMQRKELMTACKELKITEMLRVVGAQFVHETTEWMREAVIAVMDQASHLPAFTAEVNSNIELVPIHKEEKKKAPPKISGAKSTTTSSAPPVHTVTTTRPLNISRPGLKR